jgi:hypothetical protein
MARTAADKALTDKAAASFVSNNADSAISASINLFLRSPDDSYSYLSEIGITLKIFPSWSKERHPENTSETSAELNGSRAGGERITIVVTT